MADYYIDKGGDNSDGLTLATAWTEVYKAIVALDALTLTEDVSVKITAGTYRETSGGSLNYLHISKSFEKVVTFDCDDGVATITGKDPGGATGPWQTLYLVNASNVSFGKGVTFSTHQAGQTFIVSVYACDTISIHGDITDAGGSLVGSGRAIQLGNGATHVAKNFTFDGVIDVTSQGIYLNYIDGVTTLGGSMDITGKPVYSTSNLKGVLIFDRPNYKTTGTVDCVEIERQTTGVLDVRVISGPSSFICPFSASVTIAAFIFKGGDAAYPAKFSINQATCRGRYGLIAGGGFDYVRVTDNNCYASGGSGECLSVSSDSFAGGEDVENYFVDGNRCESVSGHALLIGITAGVGTVTNNTANGGDHALVVKANGAVVQHNKLISGSAAALTLRAAQNCDISKNTLIASAPGEKAIYFLVQGTQKVENNTITDNTILLSGGSTMIFNPAADDGGNNVIDRNHYTLDASFWGTIYGHSATTENTLAQLQAAWVDSTYPLVNDTQSELGGSSPVRCRTKQRRKHRFYPL